MEQYMKNKIRNIILLIISILIYACFGWKNIPYIMFSIITTFIAGKHITKQEKRKKLILVSTIIVNSSVLIIPKVMLYVKQEFNCFNSLNIFMAVGLSYYTLQVIAYIVDVYSNKIEPEKSIWRYMLCIMYIPCLFIGPINKYEDMKKTLFEEKVIIDSNIILQGLVRIVWGALKKLVIAGRIAIIISTIKTNMYSGAYALFAMLLYSIQIYANFSGGIDMVLGISKMLGIKLVENFNSPYMSENVKEFWKRWHMSLSNWLKNYIYIPLGGNRCSKIKNKINIIITFAISGFWHGINYIVWGLVHGVLVSIGNYKTKSKIINRIVNYIIISFTWCFFIWDNTKVALQMLMSVFTKSNYKELIINVTNLGLNMPNIIVLFIFTIVLFIYESNQKQIMEFFQRKSLEFKMITLLSLILLTTVLGIYGIGFNVNEFIYSKF